MTNAHTKRRVRSHSSLTTEQSVPSFHTMPQQGLVEQGRGRPGERDFSSKHVSGEGRGAMPPAQQTVCPAGSSLGALPMLSPYTCVPMLASLCVPMPASLYLRPYTCVPMFSYVLL